MSSSFGPPRSVIQDISQIDGMVLEQLALALEARGGLRTPLANLVGYQQLGSRGTYFSNGGAALGTTTSTTAVDVPSPVTVANLRAGRYIMFVGARVKMDSNANTGTVGISANGTDIGGLAAADNRRFLFNNTDPVTQSVAFSENLTSDQSITLRWLVSAGTATVYEAYLECLRLGT